MRGNGWYLAHNSGVHSPMDGYQTHEILDGWGTGNIFVANSADDVATDDPEGVGFGFRPVVGNVLTCDNTVTGAELSTTECLD